MFLCAEMYRPLDLQVMDDSKLTKNRNKTSLQFARKTSVYSRKLSGEAAATVNDDDDDDDDSMESDNVGDDADDPVEIDYVRNRIFY